MTKIKGRGVPQGFTRIPEGEHILHVFDVEALPRVNPTIVTAKMVNKDGLGWDKYPQKWDLDTDGGYAAFYYFMLNGYGVDLSEDEVDLRIVEDSYVLAEVVYKPNSDPSKHPYVNIAKTIGPADGFEGDGARADDDDD